MKYKTIGAFEGVQNVPYCKADADMAVGMGVILDRVAKTAKLPASAEDAKGCFRIVSNINDRPEAHSFEDSVAVLKGEYVRADDLTSVANLEIEFAAPEIATEYSDLAVADKLVFGVGGKLEKATAVDGYKIYFEIIGLTAYRGAGVLAVIRVA